MSFNIVLSYNLLPASQMRYIKILFLFTCLSPFIGLTQDIIVKSNGDVLRGTIKGTDFTSVKYSIEEGPDIIGGIKDIKQFVWNGETYIIKTFFNGKRADDRFVRIVETGKVNLYSVGGVFAAPAASEPRVKVRPTIGIGTGTGGFGGGVGGSITIGGGRRNDLPASTGRSKLFYFIEKPGTGALQEVSIGDAEKTRNLLLQKLGDDEDLSGRIKASESFDGKLLTAFVKAYNDMHK
ncbi:MAG: hypothetical protein EOO89_22765 [Pedobacter sp.]|nr:MAG: hypothetical protein EOO89_22765 [Pedobacter sp.]